MFENTITKRNFIVRFIIILRRFLKRIISPTPTIQTMAFLTNLGNLIATNVDFEDEQLETLVKDTINKASVVTSAAIELKELTKNDTDATTIEGTTDALIDFAAELGKAFPDLDASQADRFKTIVDNIYQNADPVKDAAVQKVFNGSVDLVFSCQALRNYANTPPAE